MVSKAIQDAPASPSHILGACCPNAMISTMAPASLLRLCLDRIDFRHDDLPQTVLDIHTANNVEPHQRHMRACLQEAFYNGHPILVLRSLAEAIWANEVSETVNTDDHTAWELIKEITASNTMAASMSLEAQDVVKRSLQFRRHQMRNRDEYVRMAQTLLGLIFQNKKSSIRGIDSLQDQDGPG